jgi:hypothetical protein
MKNANTKPQMIACQALHEIKQLPSFPYKETLLLFE